MVIFENGVQGLSDTKWQGARGQVHRLVGVDYRSKPGIITVNQKLTKDSGGTIDELCKVAIPVSDGSTLWFSSESGKIWREVAGVYTLISTTTVDDSQIHTAEDTGNSFDYSAEVNIPYGHCFSADGTIMYVICNAKVSGNDGEIFQYTLSTPWDVSTATYATKTFAADVQATGMTMKPDGTMIYIVEDGGSESVIEYNLVTPWDISTAVATGDTFSFAAQGGRGYGIQFKPDGLQMYIWDADTYEINQYTLSIAWDITSATFTGTFDLPSGFQYGGGFIHPEGTKMYLGFSAGPDPVREYVFGTAWDVTTLVDSEREFDRDDNYYFGLSHSVDVANNILYFYSGTQSGTESMRQFSLDIAPYTQGVITLGAEEFSVPAEDAEDADPPTAYIYFAIENRLLRIAVADIGATWDNQINVEIITAFYYGDDTYHPMKKQNNRLFIGDKYVIAEVNESGVVNLQTDLNVQAPERITTLGIMDTDLLVGTKELRRSWVKRWDTEALSWFAQDWVEETEIYGFLPDDNYTYVVAGDFGHIYFYDGEKMHKETRVPGEYTKDKRSKINQNAVASFFGVPVFGISNLEGNPSWQGLYSYGRFSKDYNVTMDLSYPLSCDQFHDVEIGAIIVQGYDLMVSWKTATEVGVDRIDWTLKYESAFIETMILGGPKDRAKFKSIKEILVDYHSLPTIDDDTNAIEFSVENNYQGFNDIEVQQVVDEKLYQVRATSTQKELGAVAVLLEFNVDENDAPQIENFHVNFVGEQ